MYQWEIFGDTVLYSEVYIGYLNLIALALWIFTNKIPVKSIFLISCITIVVLGAFRPADYNSDSWNYLSYVSSLSLLEGLELYNISKIEPLHVVLISIFRDYRAWLIAEALITTFLLILLFNRTKNVFSFLIPTAFVLTLNTSSLRFSLACILFSVLLTSRSTKWFYYLIITLASTSAHAVMITSGAFATRIKIMPLVFATLFLIAATYVSFVGDRVNIDYSELKSIGLKSFAVFVILSLYCFIRLENYKKEDLFFDFIGFVMIFLLTAALFPTLNRIIIIGTLVILFNTYGYDKVRKEDGVLDRGVIAIIAALIIAPYVYAIPELYFTSTW